ncbi:transcriptional regulator, AraC family [Nocardioidaceae bacterium Broad-1]|uniref:helix-turn-helix domain-containing protein n=1 Tax=Nocardioides luteus TaxID=1844 RepID=UPI000202864F|nr:helix-turn-helix domain-containing protein [Nocardioides luteus]EGD41727.1 transcriptional regulator, AraC family [Nocardioidaceae bacterium Broad-1]MBG6097105.1 AraC-like DNA-binding protein [Nocardioides luteus]
MPELDTSTLPRHERADAVITHLREIALASKVILQDADRVFMSTRVYDLGEVQVVNLRRSGLSLEVTRERDDCPPMIAMMLGSNAPATHEQFDHAVEQRQGVVDMVELNQPHRSINYTSGINWCLKFPVEGLGLSSAAIRRARPALVSSPLQAVYASHLKTLTQAAPTLAGHPATEQLGDATMALSRAVISAAADEEAKARDALHEALVPRIQVFVREHLRDPDLSPETIAAAHHISVRLLYRVLADAGLRLEQWVIDQRLDGARRELVSATGRHKPIAVIAHRWAFATPSHFTRRFRAKYGMTPREWRHTQR